MGHPRLFIVTPVLATAALLPALLPACTPFPEGCNGAAELCAAPFDEVVFPATHNSMASREDDFIGPNQEHDLRRQLEDGIRGFLLDTYDWNDDLWLCHSSCDIGAIPLVPELRMMRNFLATNEGEQLVIIFQDNISPEQTEAAFVDSGLIDFVWVPDPEDWPTLGELARKDRRVLVTAEASGPPPAWYLHAWDLFSDTGYAWDDVSEMDCGLNRGAADNPLFLMNHWVADPFSTPENALEANASEVLLERARRCARERGRPPNLIAVDFYDQGDLLSVADALNGP